MKNERKKVDYVLARAFGVRVRGYREERKLSQRQLALLAGVDPMQISRYERGIALPATDALVKIADTLKISVDALLRGKPNTYPEPPVKNLLLLERLQRIDQLDRHHQEMVVELIDAVIAKHQMTAFVESSQIPRTTHR